jgi:hypothetical protein
MKRSSTDLLLRSGPASFAVLVLAAAVGRPFANLPPPDQVVAHLDESRMRVLIGTWVESIGAMLLMTFSVGVASRLREVEGNRSPLATVALAGGVGTGTLLLARGAVVAAAAERAGGAGASAETATLAIDVGNLLIGKMAPVSLALVTGATAIAGRRLTPPWFARATAALTVGLVSPLNFLFVLPGLLWVAGLGWWLGRTSGSGPLATSSDVGE